MIRVTRRAAIAGGFTTALAVPTVAGLAGWRWRHGEDSVLLYDQTLAAGRRFAAAGETQGGGVRAIEGDRVRFTRAVLEQRPAMVAGVSRHADALLIEDVAREAGYAQVALLSGRANRCEAAKCRTGWQALGPMAEAAGQEWVEALAAFAARAGQALPMAGSGGAAPDAGLVLGWVLTPR